MAIASDRPEGRLGRYSLIRCIGRGGMGDVWEGRLEGPHGFSKAVALKILRTGPSEELDRATLIREARLGALLSHPNVVGTFELGEADGRWFVCMELVRGPSVAALAAGRPLPPACVLDVGIQVCAGLAHIHGLKVHGRPAGLVHRDIKPSNLVVDRTGLVKIVDLGIARITGGVGEAAGTPAYMAPEQSRGGEDSRADLFALGVCLVELATGVKPFGNGAGARVAIAQVDRLLADPGFLAPVEAAVPGLAEVVRRCLREQPEARWPDAIHLGQALQGVRDGAYVDSGSARAARRDASFARAAPRDASSARAGPRDSGLRQLLPEAEDGWVAGVPTPTGDRRPGAVDDSITRPWSGQVLPAARDSFVGRARSYDQVLGAILPGSIVTVLGPGGMGKTRLALECARAAMPDLSGGAWFCDLSEATEVDGLCAAVASALEVPLVHADPVSTLGHALAARGRALVILDNFEQLAAHAAVLTRWVAMAPRVSFLVTSRVVLGLRAEHVHVLGSLDVADGVALFQSRAPRPAAREELSQVEELVRRLDGLPLAIELAAARTRVLSVSGIVGHLAERFRLLSGGSADRPQRHRSLWASLDGSWQLLAPVEREAFAQLSVFSGGFTLDTADAVLDVGPDAPWMVDVITALVQSSLVSVEGERFRMLATIQAFAARQLAPSAREAAEVRHGAVFARTRDAGSELENVVAACRRAVARGDVPIATACALAAASHLADAGPYAAAVALLDEVLALPCAPGVAARLTRLRAQVADAQAPETALADLERATRLADAAGEPLEAARTRGALAAQLRSLGRLEESVKLARQSLEELRRLGDREDEGVALTRLGGVLGATGHVDEALRTLDEALAITRERRDRAGEGVVLGAIGAIWFDHGRHAEAREAVARALEIHRSVGNRRLVARSCSNLGLADLHLGRLGSAEALLGEALAIHRANGDRSGEAMDLANLARLATMQGRVEEARVALRGAIGVYRELGRGATLVAALIQLGVLEHGHGDLDAARTAYEEAATLGETVGVPRNLAQAKMNLGSLLVDHGRLDEGVANLQEAASIYHRLDHAFGLALTLVNLGGVHALVGDRALAESVTDRAVELARVRGGRVLAGALMAKALLYLDAGETGPAGPLLEEAREVIGDIDAMERLRVEVMIARWHRTRGDLEAARAALPDLDRGETTQRDVGAGAWIEVGRLRLALGDPGGAWDAAAHAENLAGSLPRARAVALCVQAEALAAQGRPERARAAHQAALAVVEGLRLPPGSPLLREVESSRPAG